jgi:galactokinase
MPLVSENARTLRAAEALARGDLEELGNLMNASHLSLRYDFEVSTERLDRLVDIALSLDGVYGARMMGGGFGGSTINLVRPDALAGFRRELARRYAESFGDAPAIRQVTPVGGAGEIARS